MSALPVRFWVWLAALAAVLWIFRRARGSFWGLSLLVLPGTLAHECCHLAVGWAMNGQPTRFTIFPKRTQGGYELGSVSFRHLRWYNAFFAGMAPLLLLGAAFLLGRWRLSEGLAFSAANLIWLYLLANLLASALPSGPDLRIAARSPIGWILLAAAMGWAWMRFHHAEPRPSPALTSPLTKGNRS